MKLKVGDKVRVKSLDWYNKNENGGLIDFMSGACFTTIMSKYCGKDAIIKRVVCSGYVLDIDEEFYFAEDSIELISNKFGMQANNISFSTNTCITLQDGQTAKICVDNGQTKIMIENKEVKEEEPKFKKGEILSCTDGKETLYSIFKGINENKTDNRMEYYCMFNCDGWLSLNASCDENDWHYATEKEKRTLFLAMLNKGMFWDENKMKVRTLKDGDIISIKDHNGDTWQSIFKEIIDNRIYSYFSLDCDGELHKKGPLGHPNQILSIRYSTTKERQTLFDKIEEKEHKKWNPETKHFENIRWRAKKGETYWCITEELNVESYIEENDSIDKALGEVNNKFKTQELAEAVANKIKELLSKM